ncbi:response regulator transcription factor [Pseudanabaena sp. UWO310]|uniref:response regulator transcription factor n=1 Tax=Pseudanabaena sp. UWO310 TaxID=2480795 RepID=UPI001160D8A1|nr:response regulator transcription factor [Pseudanabaena sp. UWO310]TYQ25253.1 response regulator transcription factor [Pseudanabaena sp. UWO310]
MLADTLRILLVEDDELFRLGIHTCLQQESDFNIVAEAEDGETALEIANQIPIDIVLLDIGLSGIGGIETCRQLKLQHKDLPILILTSRVQKLLVYRLIEVGANGYCLKGVTSDSLIMAIRSVLAGASWWDSIATEEIRLVLKNQTDATGISNTEISQNQQASNLTQREQEILELIAIDKTNKEISVMLNISTGTVSVHVHKILNKLNVSNRFQAKNTLLKKNFIAKELGLSAPLD